VTTATANEGSALIEALEGIIRKTTPDANAIRDIIEKIVDERLPRRIEVHSGDLGLGSLDEHTRPEFEKVAMAVYAGVNTLLVGPAGAGKTHLAAQVAKSMGLRFGFIPLTAGISEARLTGRFVPRGAGGAFEFLPAPFVDFYENGGLFLLDEVDAADPNVMLAINAALANGHLETPNPDKPIIQRHSQFRAMAAANTWLLGADRAYCGRNQLDAATRDRFQGKFFLDYGEAFETKVGNPDLVPWVHQIRRTVKERSIRRVVSTRLVLDGTKLINAGFTLADVQEMFFLDWSANERALIQ
jgi:MoxR-like ATPase